MMRVHHFWAQIRPFDPNKKLLGKMINFILIYLLASSIVQDFKKILTADLKL